MDKPGIAVWIALFWIFVVYCAINLYLIKDFKQLPSPILGGDYYYQLGSVYHLLDSPPSDWFKSSNILGDNPTYSPVYGLMIVSFSIITGLSPMQSIFYSNIPFILISIITAYALFYLVTKDPAVSILGVLIFLPYTAFPILKYTELFSLFAMPLFLIALYLLYEKQTLKRSIFLGIVYGFLALLHPTGLIIGTAFTLFFLAYSTFSHVLDMAIRQFDIRSIISSFSDKTKLIGNLWKSSVFFFLAFLIGFSIAQVWWFKPLFLLGGKTTSKVAEWGFQDFSSTTYQFTFLFETIAEYFLNFSGFLEAALSILGIVGLYYLLFKREEDPRSKFILLLFAASTLLTFHYFLTAPLLGSFFGPNYLAFIVFKLAFFILVFYTVTRLIGSESVKAGWVDLSQYAGLLFLPSIRFEKPIYKTDVSLSGYAPSQSGSMQGSEFVPVSQSIKIEKGGWIDLSRFTGFLSLLDGPINPIRDNLSNLLVVVKTYLPHLLVFFILMNSAIAYDGWYHDHWREAGRNQLPQQFVELQNYLLANTSVNDVILSSNELSFAINALSGRKTVAFRRGHVDPFSNLDEREIAAAVILYGNDTNEKLKLIEQYNISYVYIDVNWIPSEWSVDSGGNIIGAFDPLAVFDTPENRRALDSFNVTYRSDNVWLDPSMREGFFRKIDALQVSPLNYDLRNGPIWKDDLDKLLTGVWKSSDGSAVLYKINKINLV